MIKNSFSINLVFLDIKTHLFCILLTNSVGILVNKEITSKNAKFELKLLPLSYSTKWKIFFYETALRYAALYNEQLCTRIKIDIFFNSYLFLIFCILYNYYRGWKVPGFLMKTSVFWAKLYLFLNIVAFEGDTLGIAIFQHFDFCSMKRPSLRNTPRFPRWLPHSMWISFPGATAWGLRTDNSRWGPSLENTVGEQSIRIVIGPIWPSLSRTCVTVRCRDGTERRRK